MNNFIIKEICTQNIVYELEKIGFDSSYKKQASNKFCYKNLKIYGLTLPQANILKQTALSFGADCAVHKEVLTSGIEKTDVILGGSHSQLIKISEKLKHQPFSLKNLAESILAQLIKKDRNTKLVGILNLTPDSFSDDGIMDSKKAINKMFELIDDGASIIDIGAESTKPFSVPVSSKEQINRLKLIINEIKNLPVPVSIDTKSSEVADFVLNNGAKIINDVSAGDFDSKIFNVVASYKAEIILQHSSGNAENLIKTNDIIEDVFEKLKNKILLAREVGINNIIIDPGIGFGKNKLQNFQILNRIEELYSLNLPIMIGLSRKSFLELEDFNNDIKDSISLALAYPLIQKKIDYLRVHNVKLHNQLLKSVMNILP